MERRFVETAKPDLILAGLGMSDAADLYRLVQKNSAHLTALGDYHEVVGLSDEETAEQLSSIPDDSLVMGLFLDGDLIGRADLNSPKEGVYVLGYWVDREHTGRGYTSAACDALINHAIGNHGAREFWAGVKEINKPSIVILEKLDFRLVERLPTHLRYYRDAAIG